MDEAGRYVFMNRAYEAGLDLTRREDWLGKTVFDLHPAELARQIHANDLIVLESGAAHQFVEEGVVDGQKYAVLSHKFPMYGPDRERYLAGTTMDITERRRAEDKLRDADRRKDEFLAILAHELRNPLHPIRTLVAVLRAATPSASQLQAAADIIDRQVRQMTRLLDDLLDVSRITLNKLVLRSDTLELAAIVESALEAARPLIAAAHHKVTVTLPPLPVHVIGDETRLAQVFSNLLCNAAKYMPNGGHLSVVVELEEKHVSVAVRDAGIGIASDFLPHVFDMFSQADGPLERSAGGLGIGLALVRGLTELHGGTVEARSDGRGSGSEFIVRLPVTQAPRAQPGHAALSAREHGCRYRVLVVDDNTDGADSMKLLLESLDNEVRVAYDGIAAMEAAESFSPGRSVVGYRSAQAQRIRSRALDPKAKLGRAARAVCRKRMGAARGQAPRRGGGVRSSLDQTDRPGRIDRSAGRIAFLTRADDAIGMPLLGLAVARRLACPKKTARGGAPGRTGS